MTDSEKAPYEQFPVGSRIRVTDKYHSLHGQTGTVIEKGQYNLTREVTTRMDDGREFYWTPEDIEFEDFPAQSDPVSPDHYKFPGGMEVIDISEHLTSNGGQVVQYVARATRLDGHIKGNALEDLKKALFFLQREIERLERDAP